VYLLYFACIATEWRAAPGPGLNGTVCNVTKPIVPLSPGPGEAGHAIGLSGLSGLSGLLDTRFSNHYEMKTELSRSPTSSYLSGKKMTGSFLILYLFIIFIYYIYLLYNT
jgi:hypothetical protein